ncbi:MAG: uncharacterized protein QOH62_2132 [Solirubrobacteraceae bacterium]|jgi:uncharacterized membrane protein YuzA (DUF378 family)|nr:uncharacterized protein [Solirubrobacteraceae bacterium]
MEVIKRFEPLWLALVVIGGLNWALVGLFDRNILSDVFGGGTTTDVVYAVVGFAALMLVPALLERMHVGMRMPRAHQS